MNRWDQYVYSYVPKQALDAILTEGLFSGEALLKRPDLLELAASSRNLSSKKFKKDIEDNLKSWSKESSKGPNIVFHLIPASQKLSKKHPTKKFNLVPIKINLTELLSEYPDTKIYGMELKPYSEKVTPKDRHHFLDAKEVGELLAMSPKEMWSRYNDIEDKGLYAPDVPHASIHCNNGIIPAKYIQRFSKTAEKKRIIPHAQALEIIRGIKERIKKHEALKKAFEEHGVELNEIDDVPVCFADIDVSARTDHGIVYLNWGLLDEGFPKNDHYLAHELTHYAQQTTGDGPTKGSTDDTYLDNEYEKEGFQVQTEYLSETKGDEVANNYIDNVLDYHEVPKSERPEKKRELLQLAESKVKQLSLPLDPPRLGKSKEELLREYDEAVRRGPQTRHHRSGVLRSKIPPNQLPFVREQLQNLMQMLTSPDPKVRSRAERTRQMLQLTLGE